MKEKKVVFVHATGNQNSRHAVYGMKKAGILHSFHTSIACFKGSFLYVMSAFSFFKGFRRREFDICIKKVTYTYPFYEMLRMLNRYFPYFVTVSSDDVFHYNDEKVATFIEKKANEIVAVYSTDEGAYNTFLKAHELGVKCLFDLPIVHWRTYQRLLSNEKVKNPQWASLLEIYNDSNEKLERKDRELLLADRIYVASNFVKQSILNDFPYKLHADIEVIPYGFPPVNRQRKFNLIGERKLKFLFVGRLSQSKGLSYLFEAIESFREEIDFTIVGSGSLNECQLLKNEIKKYKYIPSLPHDKVLRLMSKNDVFIFPSLFEGFGMVITEAMSQGTPVITTTRTCGVDFIQDNENGWLVEPGNTEQIKEKIRMILANKEQLVKISKKAMETAAQRPWAVYEDELAASVKKYIDDKLS